MLSMINGVCLIGLIYEHAAIILESSLADGL